MKKVAKPYMLIPIGKSGKIFARCSPEDYELLIKYTWHLKYGYARTEIFSYQEDGRKKRKAVLMHRLINKTPDDLCCDHINRIRLDNTRDNLRNVTSFENGQNRIKSGWVVEQVNAFKALISYDKKNIHLGLYETEELAKEAIDMYLIHEGHIYRTLNFPEKEEEYRAREYIPFQKEETKNLYFHVSTCGKNAYRARLRVGDDTIHIITDEDPLVCAKAVDKYIVQHDIKDKKMNFPEDYPDYDNRGITIQCVTTEDENIVRLVFPTRPDIDALINKDDYEKIKYDCWHITTENYVNSRTLGLLDRHLLGVTDPKIFIDHRDTIRTHNQRANLEISNPQYNSQNHSKVNPNSGYLNVSKEGIGWKASFIYKGVTYSKYNKDKEYCAHWRDFKLIELGDHRFQYNFEWTEADIQLWKTKFESKTKTKVNPESGYLNVQKRGTGWKASIQYKNITYTKSDKHSVDLCARWRDLTVMGFDDDDFEYNFEWTDEDIQLWKPKLGFV